MTDWPDCPEALAGHPVDPAALGQAVREYRAGWHRGGLWALVLVHPLIIFLIGAAITIDGGPIMGDLYVGGLFVALVGGLLSWYPAVKMVRGYQRCVRVRPVIRSYENALRAAQPSPYRGRLAVHRWRRANGLIRG